jgi:2-polyprenyl-6-methoxyphenol hydroxylase-like FAD-dependent oxidoreductase
VVGDAACAFNPSYGHGMTVAALQAEVLGQMASKGTVEGRSFQRRAARVIAPAWEMATLEDFRFDETVGQRPLGTRIVHRYMDAVFSLTPHDSWASERLVRVLQLLAPSTTLFAAPMLARLARARLRALAGASSPARSAPHLVTNSRH